jgi:hypothetical protein
MNIRLLNLFIVSSVLFCGLNEIKGQRWSEKQANKWFKTNGWLCGCNFISSTAINQLEMWQSETFDTVTINRELGFARSIGFNVVRVFLHHKAWLQDTTGFTNRIGQYLTIASKHKIKTMFVLFDDCWNGVSHIGKQPDPKPGIHNSGWVTDPDVQERADTTYFPVLKKYVTNILTRFKNDKRVVIWDLYNEPGADGNISVTLNLLKHIFEWAREANPKQPLTSAAFGMAPITPTLISEFQLNNSDIITFHNYGIASEMKTYIEKMKAFHRPVICSEYMARTTGSTFKDILPLLKSEKVGAVNWGLVNGKTNTIYAWDDKSHADGTEPKLWHHDIFRPDGTPFSTAEIDLIRKECLTK